jgi:WD40 repeat protein
MFAPDGRYLYSGSDDKTVIVWDLMTGKQVNTIMNGQPVSAIAPTNDVKLVYIAGAEPKIKLYHMLSGKVLKTLDGHTDVVNDIAITNDGKYMVSGSNDKTARIWDLTTGKQIRILPVDCWKVTTISISNDNSYVTTGCNDGSVKVWELKTGKLINHIDFTGNIARNVMFGKTNQYVLGAFMLRNNTDFGLRVYKSKISLTPLNISVKNNIINHDSIKKEPLKVPKVSIQTTNKSPIQQKK